jgi:hypothetical protein
MRPLLLLGHAVVLGIVIALLCRSVGRRLGEADNVVGASGALFLCVGMAGVMILVADSLARAFAIGGAVALVRFRVKMAGRFQSFAFLYGVIAGMACGVGRIDVAWALTAIFGVLLEGVLRVRKRAAKPAVPRAAVEEIRGPA